QRESGSQPVGIALHHRLKPLNQRPWRRWLGILPDQLQKELHAIVRVRLELVQSQGELASLVAPAFPIMDLQQAPAGGRSCMIAAHTPPPGGASVVQPPKTEEALPPPERKKCAHAGRGILPSVELIQRLARKLRHSCAALCARRERTIEQDL